MIIHITDLPWLFAVMIWGGLTARLIHYTLDMLGYAIVNPYMKWNQKIDGDIVLFFGAVIGIGWWGLL